MTQCVRYIKSHSHGGRIGVLVEFALESEHATRMDPFQQLAGDVALHLVACTPPGLAELLQQGFVKNPSCSIAERIEQASRAVRERISIVRFVRWDTKPAPAEPTHPPRAPASRASGAA
ncbi:hypothetical protein [Tahibacter caeni]|uniref:hypothetical protein n=1 Tax=Tahibacter caeni TaxID=1453545 RepID=UPI0021484DBA|nr:hypothetical protein [Tahibacter caeni]